AEWNELVEPFFAVVELSNIHRPRIVDPKRMPFQPSLAKDGEGGSPAEVWNFYKNAVYRSDAEVARLVAAVRASRAGPRTIIVFTSDHGEGFGEHAQGINHSGSV